MKNPHQPITQDRNGTLRFKENKIVSFLQRVAADIGFDMNQLAIMDFDDDDRQQFAQLIGYSVSGYGELSYVSEETYDEATAEQQPAPDTAHVICCNDMVVHTVIGSDEAAVAKLGELRRKDYEQHKTAFHTEVGDYSRRYFWHIHDTPITTEAK